MNDLKARTEKASQANAQRRNQRYAKAVIVCGAALVAGFVIFLAWNLIF